MNHDFDIAAATYDTHFTESKIGKAQRSQVYHYLQQTIAVDKKLDVLELNCGTGADANHIGKYGHDVIATDISPAMIQVCQSKPAGVSVIFEQQDITTISRDTFSKKFNLIFSNFGGFNCLSREQLIDFLKMAPDLLTKNGKLILVIMPKHTLWEQIYFTLKGEISKSKRRKTDSFVLANVEGIDVKTWYFNPKDIIQNSPSFDVLKVKPIGLWVPPSYLENSILGKKSILGILKTLDRVFHWSFLSKYADHFYIEFEKNESI